MDNVNGGESTELKDHSFSGRLRAEKLPPLAQYDTPLEYEYTTGPPKTVLSFSTRARPLQKAM